MRALIYVLYVFAVVIPCAWLAHIVGTVIAFYLTLALCLAVFLLIFVFAPDCGGTDQP